MKIRAQDTGAVAQRVERVNMLRGAATLGVLAIHTSAHFKYVEEASAVVYANIVVDVFAHFAVPLFIALSGITLALRYSGDAPGFDTRQFLTRRLLKIIPPYVVFSLLYLLLFALEFGPPAPASVVIALLTGGAYYHLWFVALLIQLYLLFPFLRAALKWAERRGAQQLLLLAGLLLQLVWNLGAPLLLAALPERPLFEAVLSERFFLSHLFYFLLGMAVGTSESRAEDRIRRLSPAVLALTALATLTVISWIWSAAVREYGSLSAAPARVFLFAVAVEPLLFLAIMALLWQGVLLLPRTVPLFAKALAHLGVLSLPIYLVHVFWQWLLARAMAAYGVMPADWLFYPALFVGTLALSYGAASMFARMPFAELLTGAPRAT